MDQRTLEARTGNPAQWADLQLMTVSDGPGLGMRSILLTTAGGLQVEILPDRGLDLARARFKGINLTWLGPGGDSHPHARDQAPRGWGKSFHGGLMTLCGLENIGPPSIDVGSGTALGQHGEITFAQAEGLILEKDHAHNRLCVKGTLRQAYLGGSKLQIDRTLEADADGTSIALTDRVRNSGWQSVPLMVLYHSNFGWPFVSEDLTWTSPSPKVEPRDEAATRGRENWHTFEAPQPGFEEQVYFHHLTQGAIEPWATARLENPVLGLGVELSFDSSTLTHLTQWKLCGHGDYVLGIEPGNAPPLGQWEAQKAGALPMLEPGEEVEFHLEWEFFELPKIRRA